ncbi:MAG TPA: hypothetical protein VK604_09740 [Bryobacteraceae bacterium]|nr:hypothetical protein [Bryobacteraceae bacterium]
MASTSLVKVTSAFVAGIVVALGSAIIYVRMNEVTPPSHEVLQSPPDVRRAPEKMAAIPAVQPPVQPAAAPKPAPASTPKHVIAKAVARPVAHLAGKTPKSKPIEVARRAPLPAAAPAPVAPAPVFVPPPVARPATAAPAVNEAAALNVPHAEALPAGSPPPAPVQAPERHVVTLQQGTSLAVRLGETLSTDHNYTGDTFRATLEAPIVIDGFIIADRGSKVLGTILSAQKAGRMAGTANLSLALTEINTTDGQRIQIETSQFAKQGDSSTGQNAAKMASGAALGAIIGALGGGGKGAAIGAGVGGAAGTGAVLLTHGKPAVLSAETQLTFQLSRPTVVTEQLN